MNTSNIDNNEKMDEKISTSTIYSDSSSSETEDDHRDRHFSSGSLIESISKSRKLKIS